MNKNNTDNINEINLKLTVDEVNLVLEALGNQPFARVYSVVGKIQEEAAIQLNGKQETVVPEKKKKNE